MHFNIYIDDETGKRLATLAKRRGISRNALIREALAAWVDNHGRRQWPREVLEFKGMPDMPRFESYRSELIEQGGRDPFA